jgi:energy-converting hydrogenase B subunit D
MPLQATAFLLAAVGAVAVVLVRDPLRQIIVNGLYGLVLVALFVILQAPDVALSMLVTATVAYPVIVLIAVARVHAANPDRQEEG